MTFDCRTQKLDQETKHQHRYLTNDDFCLYIGDYICGRNYSAGPFNDLINNFKKSPSKRQTNPHEFAHKAPAIMQIADCFRRLLKDEYLERHITLVPIPPSKIRADPEYDDRMVQVCNHMVNGLTTPDVRNLIEVVENREATHISGYKPPPNELIGNYQIVSEAGYAPREHIMLLDDVITTGSHFKACQMLLHGTFPGVQVHGMFIARAIPPDNE